MEENGKGLDGDNEVRFGKGGGGIGKILYENCLSKGGVQI